MKKNMTPLFDGIKLNCTVVSDTHIDTGHPMPGTPVMFLEKVLEDSMNSVCPVDAFLTVGDTTSRGNEANWELALKSFEKFTPAKKILLTIGNHDAWNDDGYADAAAEFYKYTDKICGKKIDKTYFSEIINGYHFIFLGTDDEAGCDAHISDEQFSWFCKEMHSAAESNKPIFVFCHQSLNQKHGLPKTWDEKEDPNAAPDEGGIGARSDEIEKVLKSYKNVFYFSGHSHMGLSGEKNMQTNGYASIENDDGVTLINLPSLACGNHHGDIRSRGVGFQLEVYEDKVILRPRNYRKHKWITSVMFKDSLPYYSVELK